jgi:plastocyanin
MPRPAPAAAAAADVPAALPPVTVQIARFAFSPGTVTAALGQVIRWTNNDSVRHTVTADDGSWKSSDVEPGGTFEVIPAHAGTYTYHCTIHPFMIGTVVVAGS